MAEVEQQEIMAEAFWNMLPEIQQAQLRQIPDVRAWREKAERANRKCNQCQHYRPLGAGSGTCFKGFAQGTIYSSGFCWAPKCQEFEE